ncbi:MAG TPA: hypothetical protein PKZ75_07770 [Bacteroidia bacterium]|nr:hypothetical protein [Bacteroidia bacterium]
MDKNLISYQFWFWTPKLEGILAMLAELAKYQISQDEIEAIKIGLVNTSDEKNNWFDYILYGETYKINLKLAYDTEEGPDMIHINIKTSFELEQKLQALNLFQSMFRQLDTAN